MRQLYENINYNSGIPYIFSSYIREYDIKKANISILYDEGVISKSEYEYLYSAKRIERQKYIGLLQKKDNKITETLKQGIIEAKRNLFLSNSIDSSNVLCIKNDAVYIISRELQYTKFGNVEFIMKNQYTSFMNIMNIEFYYGYNRVDKSETFDIKGLGKYFYLHDAYMSDFICYILNSIENESIETVITDFKSFYEEYINKKLPIPYYREYNPQSMYSIINTPFKVYYLENNDDNKNAIDISYNLNLLRILFGYISSYYFINRR